MELPDATRKLDALRNCELGPIPPETKVVGIIPVTSADMDEVHAFASRHGLWVVEDAAHGFPTAWRRAKSNGSVGNGAAKAFAV